MIGFLCRKRVSPALFCLLLAGCVWGCVWLPTESTAQIRRPEQAPASLLGNVAGQVTDQVGRPLARVQLIASLEATELTFGTVSDRDGQFLITGLPAGEYLLVASILEGPARQSLPQRFRLEAGQELTLSVEIPTPDTVGLTPRPRRRQPADSPAVLEDPESFPPTPAVRPRPEEVPLEATRSLPGVAPRFLPLGNAGGGAATSIASLDFVLVDDRWRIGFPRWDRYGTSLSETYPFVTGSPIDPYNLNVLKGDYPILGSNWFLALEGRSETIAEYRSLPVAGPPAPSVPVSPGFSVAAISSSWCSSLSLRRICFAAIRSSDRSICAFVSHRP